MADTSCKTIKANGLRFAYLEVGKGQLILCLHGFPDTPHTFQLLLNKLGAAGYHAVAPFMRGIFPTSIPADKDYSPLQLGQDALAMIVAFGQRSAVIIGHDWGALSAYAAANVDPARISKMITIAIPHPRAIRMNLRSAGRKWHFAFLSLPFVAEFLARRNDYALLRHFRRSWSPNIPTDRQLTSDIRCAYSNPGTLKAALGYYRSFPRAFLGIGKKGKRAREILLRKTSVPTLCFAGNEDGVFENAAFDRTPEAFTGFYELVKMQGAGHFLHLECSEEFTQKVLDFLQRAPV